MRIKGVFFDAAGVLYARAHATRHYVARLLEERGFSSQLLPEQQACQKALRTEADRGRSSPDEYWDQVLQMHGVVGAEERKALVTQIDGYADQVALIPGAREALLGLKERGFVVGVITNTMHTRARKERWLEAVGVLGLLDVLVCSTEVGARKPEPAIYLRAVEQAHLTPDEAAFVGHAEEELDGARQAGLVTVAVRYDAGARADYYAAAITDLLNVPVFLGSGR